MPDTASPPTAPTPDTLPPRCERCGYSFRGLAPLAATADAPCPECGTPISQSRPERRPGSPWQQNPNLRGWLLTLLASVWSPRRLFHSLRFPEPRAVRLLMFNLILATVILTAPSVWTFFAGSSSIRISTAPNSWLVIPDATLPRASMFIFLTILVPMGVAIQNHHAAKRRNREAMAPSVAWCVHAHIAFSLIALSPLYLAGWLLFRFAIPHDVPTPPTTSENVWIQTIAALPRLATYAILIWVAAISYFAERINRYASPIRASIPASSMSAQ